VHPLTDEGREDDAERHEQNEIPLREWLRAGHFWQGQRRHHETDQ